MKYIEEAIDTVSEYGRKYLELVSRGDYGDNLEVHHIVPVAYFADVLGIKECRTSKSPEVFVRNSYKELVGQRIEVDISGATWQLDSPDGHYSWVATWESAI